MNDGMPVEALLDGYPLPHRRIAERLREIVTDAAPEAIERVRPGWQLIGYDLPVAKRRTRFAIWIWVQPEHVHLGFVRGVLMDDPDGRLQGRGETKLARWLTFDPGAKLDTRELRWLVRECLRVEGLSRAEQEFLKLERSTPLAG
jgi:hypothetical protein